MIDIDPIHDERGFFTRSWCRKEFEAHGLNSNLVQCNTSFNKSKGTLRGMHYQKPPYEESKLVRCTRGSIYDVIIDLRKNALTFKQWFGAELSADNSRAIYIPEGFAHGFITLEDNSEVFYQMSEYFVADVADGARWDDPAFAIEWPFSPDEISIRDQNFTHFGL